MQGMKQNELFCSLLLHLLIACFIKLDLTSIVNYNVGCLVSVPVVCQGFICPFQKDKNPLGCGALVMSVLSAGPGACECWKHNQNLAGS